MRPVWAEINLDNLAHNIREVKRVTKKGVLITAVVKADAYGHGSIMAAKTFLENGADRLAVATLSEAIELRDSGIKEPILIFGYTPIEQLKEVIEYDIIQTVYSYEQAAIISKEAQQFNKIGKIHIKVDTGMNRIGFKPDTNSIDDIVRISKLTNVYIEGIFTHFAVADEKEKTFTRKQYDKFCWMINELEKQNIKILIKHVSNSAAIIDLPEYNLDMVRAGIMLYGLYPSDNVKKERVDLRPAMTLKAKIAHIKNVEKGTGISYGHVYITNKNEKIGTLPLGYADGFTRILTNKAEVGLKGKRVPVVGRICMDQCMIKLTDIEHVKVGDEVVIFGNGENNSPHTDEIAKKIGTINYEVVCMISRRVPRVYTNNKEITEISDYLID